MDQQVEYLADRIFMIGCMKILRKMYERDLVTLLLFYGIGGTIMALIELISAALSFAYMGQIHRRQKREWTPGEDVTAGNGVNSDGMPMDDFPSN